MRTAGRRCVRFLCVLLAAGAFVRPASAQVPGGTPPDVQVVVMPHPSGQWAVSAVYPKVVSKVAMQAHLTRLLSVSGWKGSGVTFETHGLPKNDGNLGKLKPGARLNHENLAPGGVDPPMSSVTFLSRSSIIDWKGSSLPVEPFARAFRDLNRVYVTFFVPPPFTYRGLRRPYSDTNLDMVLSASGGAYTYALKIKNHKLGALNLPRSEVVPQGADVRAASAGRERLQLVGTGVVILLAAAAGVLVYGWTHRWSGR